ncbi:MAG: nucleotidyltransferase domain-containing protein [Thermoplasmata archaeon]
MAIESLPELHCYRCIYTWTPRRLPVRMCPRCKSRLWNTPNVRPISLGEGLGIPEVIGAYRARVLALVRRYGVKRVRVFGSVRRRSANERSDVDLLVDELPRASLLDHARLEIELGKLLGRTVDVTEEGSLPWSIRPQVLAEAVPL